VAKDPFVEEYLKGMAAVRKSRPKKRAKLSLGKGTKVEPRFLDELKVENRYQPRERNPQTDGDGSSLTAGYDTKTDQAFRAIGDALGNQGPTEALRFIDDNLLGIGNAEQAAFNVGRGEGTGWDAADLAFAAPVAGAVAKPFGALARGIGRVASPLAARVAETAPMQYLREARPLVDNADDAIQTAFSVTPGAQRRITNQRPRVQGLPAPEQRLGLPAPGPGLPEYAAKPRGGNWWPADAGPYTPLAPREAAKEAAYMGERFSSDPADKALVEWWDRALPRYLQNDFATPDDPLRALADQGYIPGMQNAMQWSGAAKQDIVPYPLQKLLFDEKTAAAGVRDEALAAMPWINKLPQTENIYGVWPRESTKEVYAHVKDEMRNALRAEQVGLPADLAVRPESLARMSFPQAVERVGRINQWRAKQAEQAQLSALNSPAVQMFKEYPDDPNGMRWVELRAPELGDELPEGLEVRDLGGQWAAMDLRNPDAQGRPLELDVFNTPEQARRTLAQHYARSPLQDALRYEGDTMGHCVGGYCDDVLSGRSRIFSLRDAKGEPHVTIETAPRGRGSLSGAQLNEWEPDLFDQYLAQRHEENGIGDMHRWLREVRPDIADAEDIIQIKGKQNRAPKEDYLPFVQDFVKSGQWGDIGDFGNTGLTKLPDGRFLTPTQITEALSGLDMSHPRVASDVRWLSSGKIGPEDGVWEHYMPYFEGYARGGRVSGLAAKPCSCDKSLAVR
jgi:hypothetical protein